MRFTFMVRRDSRGRAGGGDTAGAGAAQSPGDSSGRRGISKAAPRGTQREGLGGVGGGGGDEAHATCGCPSLAVRLVSGYRCQERPTPACEASQDTTTSPPLANRSPLFSLSHLACLQGGARKRVLRLDAVWDSQHPSFRRSHHMPAKRNSSFSPCVCRPRLTAGISCRWVNVRKLH